MMDTYIKILIFSLCFGTLLHAQKERKLLFIGIDGVRQDALAQANTPNIDELTANGVYTYDSWHLGITSSGPSWSTMLTGVWEAKHKVTNNSYSGADFNNYPYFTNYAKRVKPDLKAVQIVTWNPMAEAGVNAGGNVFNSMWDRTIDPGDLGQGVVTATAKIQLLDPDLDILFIHFDEVDAAGHGFGFAPDVPQYMNAIEGADAEIGEVIAAVKARPTYDQEDWLILSTTDHGGNGFGHGGNSDIERHIWWFASGDAIPNMEITGSDPGSYQMPNNPVDSMVLDVTPVLADIAVTALDWILPETNPEEQEDWNLDGRSWLRGLVSTEEVLHTQSTLKVFPNPASSNFVHVQLANRDEGGSILRLMTLDGQIVEERNISQKGDYITETFDASDYLSGLYIVSLQNANSYLTSKLIINK